VIRIFVGTDSRMGKAETVLEHSLKKHSSEPINIHWMRAEDLGFEIGNESGKWNIGRKAGKPYTSPGWATDFTCFRFAVPELCGFEGKAMYLDADMYVRRDIAELWNTPTTRGYSCVGPRTDVAVLRCDRFTFPEWPSLGQIKRSAWKIGDYCKLLQKYGQYELGALPNKWDCLDGKGYHPEKTALVHFTNMRTQPWKPWPESFNYPPHPCKAVVDEFWSLYKEATREVQADTNRA